MLKIEFYDLKLGINDIILVIYESNHFQSIVPLEFDLTQRL
jgi:hypothetical protein